MDLDIDHLRGWIGREEVQAELLTGALVQRFNATFDQGAPIEDGAELGRAMAAKLLAAAGPGFFDWRS